MSAAVSPAVSRYLDAFGAASDSFPGAGQAWLDRLRGESLAAFRELGFPGPRVEDWKYTRTTAIEGRAFRAADAGAPPGAQVLTGLVPEGLECTRLTFVDGRHEPSLSSPHPDAAGVTIKPLSQALAAGDEIVSTHLGQCAGAEAGPFGSLNTAFVEEGAFIHLAKGAAAPAPIHLLFLSSGRSTDALAHPRILVVADSGASATIIESYEALEESVYFTNAVTEVALTGPGAKVRHYKLQRESRKAFHIATLHARQVGETTFDSNVISLGAQLARGDINAHLGGAGAHCAMLGLFLASGRQHMDFHTRVEHARESCTSDEHYKGILDGRARGVFNGRVHVHQDAQHTEAHQRSDNLLLSRHAEIDTKPELEIHADDVKCSHGATIGQLDETMLFYLRSRGIDPDRARSILTYGFARDIIDRMPDARVRDWLGRAVTRTLPDGALLEDLVG